MNTVVALAFVLAAVFVATECESPPLTHFRYRKCYNGLRRCTVPLKRNRIFAAVVRDKNQLIDHIDDVCEILEPVERCIRPKIRSCHEDLQKQLRSIIFVKDFLCSDEGKSTLRQYTTSECYNNPIKSYELQGFTELCLAEAAANQPTGDGEDVRCQILADSTECIVRKTTNLCGDAAGRLIDGIVSHIVSIYTNRVCTVEETRDLFSRQADVFRRFIARDAGLDFDEDDDDYKRSLKRDAGRDVDDDDDDYKRFLARQAADDVDEYSIG